MNTTFHIKVRLQPALSNLYQPGMTSPDLSE
jgi:hypothetical protein